MVTLGGYYVTTGVMTYRFFCGVYQLHSYLNIPILVIGFISNIIAQASTSYERINEVLSAPDVVDFGTKTTELTGNITVEILACLLLESRY